MEGDDESLSAFSIDRYNGRVILKKTLDFEKRIEYKMRVTASDGKHTTSATLVASVSDVNDNVPQFSQPYYQFALQSK